MSFFSARAYSSNVEEVNVFRKFCRSRGENGSSCPFPTGLQPLPSCRCPWEILKASDSLPKWRWKNEEKKFQTDGINETNTTEKNTSRIEKKMNLFFFFRFFLLYVCLSNLLCSLRTVLLMCLRRKEGRGEGKDGFFCFFLLFISHRSKKKTNAILICFFFGFFFL